MKELTIEQKARAYDDAKARMSRAFNTNRCTIGFMNEIFLEFREDNDERIRKGIIRNLKYLMDRSEGFVKEDLQERIAWLEKQDKHQSTDDKEKLEVLKFIRKETCCGLDEANEALLKLIKVLKEHPLPIMDKPCKLKIEWEEQK